MVDHKHGGRPVDVQVEDNYPFLVNTPGFVRKAFAMLTPFVDDEKTVVKGRRGQKLLCNSPPPKIPNSATCLPQPRNGKEFLDFKSEI